MSKNPKFSFKKAAYAVLKDSRDPLSAKAIVEVAFERELLSTEGKTPEATMAAQLYVDINSNRDTPFKKVGKGKFTLKDKADDTATPLVLIEKQNDIVKNDLMQQLYEMDPFQFEYLIADLLQKLGYENVGVTKFSGDQGIDVVANLTLDGVTDVKTVIQAKRYKKGNNIPGKIITQLRGSAEVDQRGLVITTSDFTKDAVKESKAPNKMPVSLVNGEKLLKLLIKHNIGIQKETVTLYALDAEYFENDDVEETKIPGKGKNKALWPLPGGVDSYTDTLYQYLGAIESGIQNKSELIAWYLRSFDNVQSEKTVAGYINVPKSMGLTSTNDGKISLTLEGQKVLESRDKDYLFEVISQNVLAFDDIVEYIKLSEKAVSSQEVLDYLNENFDIEWTTFAQVNFRTLWLENLGKIKKMDGGFTLV